MGLKENSFTHTKEALMHYAGIDLHRRTVVIAIETEDGSLGKPESFSCSDVDKILRHMDHYRPFRAVIEASGCYRWLYDALAPMGDVVLAHPLRLKAIVAGRAKTDKLDAQLLARLLKTDLIPTAYVPPDRYQRLRDLTRFRIRLVQHRTEAKNELHALLARSNVHVPCKTPWTKRWRWHVSQVDLGQVGNETRNEIFRRVDHFDRELRGYDDRLYSMAEEVPEVAALSGIHGIGLFSALLIIGEIGEPRRFSNKGEVGAYAGLTARVSQSGEHSYYGHITRQGSRWLRWVLVEAAMKAPQKDAALNRFYTRIRKRSSAMIARVAVARKLAEICWVRLMAYEQAKAA
jgi:transposase